LEALEPFILGVKSFKAIVDSRPRDQLTVAANEDALCNTVEALECRKAGSLLIDGLLMALLVILVA